MAFAARILLVAVLLALGIARSTSADITEIELPKMQPLQPMDGEIRLGLYIQVTGQYTLEADIINFKSQDCSNFFVPCIEQYILENYREFVPPVPGSSTLIQEWSVGFLPAYTQRMAEVVKSLFPSSRILQSPTNPEVDLLVHADMNVKWQAERTGSIGNADAQIEVLITLTFLEPTGKPIVSLESLGSAQYELKFTFSRVLEKMGQEALRNAFDNLVEQMRTSDALSMHLKALAENRALPSGLEVSVRFDDESSHFPNGQLDAGEAAQLIVQIINRGPGPAFDVKSQAGVGSVEMATPAVGIVGDLRQGEQREVSIPIASRLGLQTGIARVRIDTTEKRGYGSQPVVLEVATAALLRPQIEIVDVTLNDRTGRASGDGDGQPANGETLEAIIRLRNAGPGEAIGVAVTGTSTHAGIHWTAPEIEIPRILRDQVQEARLLLALPITYSSAQMPLVFEAIDRRGAEVARTSRAESWNVRLKRPAVEVSAFRFYDGNSAASIGNRDERINNGERIEVALSVKNRGEITARGVRLVIKAEDPDLSIGSPTFELGDLPAQTETPEQRFLFEVPRTWRRDGKQELIHLTWALSQTDFPVRTDPVTIPFLFQAPTLLMDATGTTNIARGSSGELFMQVRNTGELIAEEVAIEVEAANPDLVLLDERGVPNPKWRRVLEPLAPQGASPRLRLGLRAKQSAATGSALVRVLVSQKDFPPLRHSIELTVAEGEVVVIPAAPPVFMPDSTPSREATATPAAISFLHPENGERLTDETTLLRFEVQSPGEPAEVRLTQNRRLLPLEGSLRSTDMSGGLQVRQYGLPVELYEGENDFEVVVVTGAGTRSSRSLSLTRERETGRIWVVGIGISDYSDEAIPDLKFAEADAYAVVDHFRDTLKLPSSQVFLLTGEEATLRNIKSVLGKQLLAKASRNDTVILFFAGHGDRERVGETLDPDGLSKYLLPYDATRADLYSTALEMDEISKILRRLVPERIVVILDSCFSGAVSGRSPFEFEASERSSLSGEFLERMARAGRGRVVLTASGPNEAAKEDASLGHGVFTHFLLEGLRGKADSDRDGEIDADEVFRYTSEKVTHFTSGKQHPERKAPDSAGRILLGRTPVLLPP